MQLHSLKIKELELIKILLQIFYDHNPKQKISFYFQLIAINIRI